MQDEIKYLGHRIDENGLHPNEDKVNCILNAPEPTDESTLRAFLGQMTYYTHFVDNLSKLTSPLNKLLRKDQPWEWGIEQQAASNKLLIHYERGLAV